MNNESSILSTLIGSTVVCIVAAMATTATAQVVFDPPLNFAGGDGMRAVIALDIDGDGYLDLASADKSGGTTSVFLNNGNGTFASRLAYPVGVFPFSVASADFDRDGRPDLVVANGASDSVSVLRNVGGGAFDPATETLVGTEPHGVAAGDWNRDGNADLAVANLGDDSVTILGGDGSGGFAVVAEAAVGPEPISIVAADINGDGALDLAVLNNGFQFVHVSPTLVRHFGTVSVLLNHGDGTFAPEARYEVAQNPFQVIAADLDGDGTLDLATANHLVSSAVPHTWASLLFNLGDGTFAPEVKVETGGGFDASVVATDLDGDGSLDLVTAGQWTPGAIVVMTNDGLGNFAPAMNFEPGGLNAPSFVVSGDFDNDGDSDVIAASQFSDNFVQLRNQLVPNPPVLLGTPNLTGQITKARSKLAKGLPQLEVELAIDNTGDGPTGGLFAANLYLSSDATLDPAADTLVTSFFFLADIPAGTSDKQKLKRQLSVDPAGQYLLVQIDPDDRIVETDETDNFASRLLP